jgi:hypothetical protein
MNTLNIEIEKSKELLKAAEAKVVGLTSNENLQRDLINNLNKTDAENHIKQMKTAYETQIKKIRDEITATEQNTSNDKITKEELNKNLNAKLELVSANLKELEKIKDDTGNALILANYKNLSYARDFQVSTKYKLLQDTYGQAYQAIKTKQNANQIVLFGSQHVMKKDTPDIAKIEKKNTQIKTFFQSDFRYLLTISPDFVLYDSSMRTAYWFQKMWIDCLGLKDPVDFVDLIQFLFVDTYYEQLENFSTYLDNSNLNYIMNKYREINKKNI